MNFIEKFRMDAAIAIAILVPANLGAYSPLERSGAFLQGIQAVDSDKLEQGQNIFGQLETDGYGERQAFLYFQLGRVWKAKAKIDKVNAKYDYEKALEYFVKYKSLVPNDANGIHIAAISIAYTYFNLSNPQKGLDELKEYLQTHAPDDDSRRCEALLQNSLGMDHSSSGNFVTALPKIKLAFENDPKPLFAQNLLFTYMRLLDKKNTAIEEKEYFEAAEKLYQKLKQNKKLYSNRDVRSVCNEFKNLYRVTFKKYLTQNVSQEMKTPEPN